MEQGGDVVQGGAPEFGEREGADERAPLPQQLLAGPLGQREDTDRAKPKDQRPHIIEHIAQRLIIVHGPIAVEVQG